MLDMSVCVCVCVTMLLKSNGKRENSVYLYGKPSFSLSLSECRILICLNRAAHPSGCYSTIFLCVLSCCFSSLSVRSYDIGMFVLSFVFSVNLRRFEQLFRRFVHTVEKRIKVSQDCSLQSQLAHL